MSWRAHAAILDLMTWPLTCAVSRFSSLRRVRHTQKLAKFIVDFSGFYLVGRESNVLWKHMGRYSSLGLNFLVLVVCICHCTAFYLPGLAPVSYCEPGKQTNPACLVSVVYDAFVIPVSPSLCFSGHTVDFEQKYQHIGLRNVILFRKIESRSCELKTWQVLNLAIGYRSQNS